MIRVIDIETAGLEPPAGVCQIGWCDVIDDGMLNWILGKDFDEDVMATVRHEIERRRKEQRT